MQISGLPVVDASRRLMLRISKTDIKKGKSKDPGACAAARCALRSVKNVEQVRVHKSRTYLNVGRKWVRYHTPVSLRTEIVSFDRAGVFEPGSYVLTPMNPAHRGGVKRKAGAHPHKYTGKRRAKYHVVTGVRAFGANR
jgi:hypothetical protein